MSTNHTTTTTTEQNTSQIYEPRDQDEYDRIIKQAKAVFVDFGTSWCGPCQKLGKDLHTWIDEQKKYSNVTVLKIDAEKKEFTELCEQVNVTSVPTIIFFKNGKPATFTVEADGKTLEYSKMMGYNQKLVPKVLEWLNS